MSGEKSEGSGRRDFLEKGAALGGALATAGCLSVDISIGGDNKAPKDTDTPVPTTEVSDVDRYFQEVMETAQDRIDQFQQAFASSVNSAELIDTTEEEAREVENGDTFYDGDILIHNDALPSESEDDPTHPKTGGIQIEYDGSDSKYFSLTHQSYPVKTLDSEEVDLAVALEECEKYHGEGIAWLQRMYMNAADEAASRLEAESGQTSGLEERSLDELMSEMERVAQENDATNSQVYSNAKEKLQDTKEYLESRKEHYESVEGMFEFTIENSMIKENHKFGNCH